MIPKRRGRFSRAAPPDRREAASRGHVPVLLDAVLAALMPRDGALYVDATFGDGGYTAGLLGAAECRVVAIDRDPEAVQRGRELARQHPDRLIVIEGNFADMAALLAPVTTGPIAGIAFDLGVSSNQLDAAERGFSFRLDGPLDMRMGASGTERGRSRGEPAGR